MSPSARNPKLSIEQLKSRVVDQVLERELSDLTRFRRLIHSMLKIAVMVGRDFVHNQTSAGIDCQCQSTANPQLSLISQRKI